MTSPRGFSLVELLMALTVCALVSGGVAAVVPPARVAFESTPAEIDLQQRARTAADVIAQSLRTAGADAVAATSLGPFSGIVPAVIPTETDGQFTRLTVIAPRPAAAQGVLDRPQSHRSGALVLGPAPCPIAPLVCGFVRGATAVITDGSGRFDVFRVGAVDAAANQIAVTGAFPARYDTGAAVVEVDLHTYQLEQEQDGSTTLVRVTGAGAVQPIVDRVSRLVFELFGEDHLGAVVQLPLEAFTDGPWWHGGPDGSYDADVFRIRRVDVAIALHAAAPASTERTFRFAVVLRNAP